MNSEERAQLLKKRSAAVAMVFCFVAVIAMVGVYTFSNYQKTLEQQLAEAEIGLEETENESTSANTDEIVLPETDEITSGTEEDLENTEMSEGAGQTDTTSTTVTHEVWFDESSTLDWPASGSVLINYSMDKSVYFQTLDQYKYNPALIISGNVGENIGASAAGFVTAVEQDAQTGLTVTLNMGNGYSAVYGQLKEVPVKVGDYVEEKQIVGYLSEPTKYFSVEGPNLYFQILKDGEPVNPMDYMEG